MQLFYNDNELTNTPPARRLGLGNYRGIMIMNRSPWWLNVTDGGMLLQTIPAWFLVGFGVSSKSPNLTVLPAVDATGVAIQDFDVPSLKHGVWIDTECSFDNPFMRPLVTGDVPLEGSGTSVGVENVVQASPANPSNQWLPGKVLGIDSTWYGSLPDGTNPQVMGVSLHDAGGIPLEVRTSRLSVYDVNRAILTTRAPIGRQKWLGKFSLTANVAYAQPLPLLSFNVLLIARIRLSFSPVPTGEIAVWVGDTNFNGVNLASPPNPGTYPNTVYILDDVGASNPIELNNVALGILDNWYLNIWSSTATTASGLFEIAGFNTINSNEP